MRTTTAIAAVAGLLLPVGSAAPDLPPISEPPSRLARRSAPGSGPLGLVTVDDSHRSFPAKAMKLGSAPSSPESTVSEFVGECLTVSSAWVLGAFPPLTRRREFWTELTRQQPTQAKYDDCAAAIGFLQGYPGNISVAADLCHNWWEGSCLVKVCAVTGPYTGKAVQIANTITSTLLNPCLDAQGKSGVDSDCSAINSQCGSFRYWLQEYTGEYDWAL
ncbi:uncharacterized protein PG998_001698 [Apiospora kogelbergensis]|uniref:Uncharacterized protein n=1 Tax=Apiospora kogelbergensis TaxID=1337665 RepID=A0AAW0QSN7_9PEZI